MTQKTPKKSIFTAIQTQQAARILRKTRERLQLQPGGQSQVSSDLVALENIIRVAKSATAEEGFEKTGQEVRALSECLLSRDPQQHARASDSFKRVSQDLSALGVHAF